jgi:hypothetical protein
MSEFRDGLDAEARRVRAEPDALERLKARARRRRIRRQVGSGVAALAVAGAGFAFAFNAFRGGPQTGPAVGPTMTPSPHDSPWWRPIVVVAGPARLEHDINSLSRALTDEGYNVEVKVFVHGTPVEEHTILEYKTRYLEEAVAIREEIVPVFMFEAVSWPRNRADIQITIGGDYRELANSRVQVRVLDVSGRPGVARAAADLLGADGYDIVEVGEADPIYETTIVACAPNHDEEGLRILKRYFPDADFRGEIPSEDHDVTVYLGPDFELPGAGAEN